MIRIIHHRGRGLTVLVILGCEGPTLPPHLPLPFMTRHFALSFSPFLVYFSRPSPSPSRSWLRHPRCFPRAQTSSASLRACLCFSLPASPFRCPGRHPVLLSGQGPSHTCHRHVHSPQLTTSTLQAGPGPPSLPLLGFPPPPHVSPGEVLLLRGPVPFLAPPQRLPRHTGHPVPLS